MIKIGEKIKSLRKSKSISQETLAEYLSVSFQAVSKWETGAAMPDITLVPAIASFFGISTDELFDFNVYEIEKNVEKIVHEHKKYYDTDREKCEAVIREGLTRYPGNDTLLNCLVEVIPVPERAGEVIELCKALAESTRFDDIRIDAYRIMAEAYASIGELSYAKDAIEHIPEIYFTKLGVMADLLYGEDKLYGAAKQRTLAFDWLITSCVRLAEYYKEKGEVRNAEIQLTMAKNVLLSAKDDFATKYTRSLYEAYGEGMAELEELLADLKKAP